MVHYGPVYLVEIQKLKDAAKDIKKANKHIKLNHTQILNLILRVLGFSNYNEYEQILHKNNNRWSKTLHEMKYHELDKLRTKFTKYFKRLSIEIDSLYFIDNVLKSKVHEMKRFDGFSIIVYLYTLPYILDRKDLKCVEMYNAQNIKKGKVTELLKIVLEKYKNSNNNVLNVFSQINPEYKNKNIFEIYEDMKSKQERVFENIDNLSLLKEYGAREFFFALKNLYDDEKYKEGFLFDMLYKLYKDDVSIEDVLYFIEMDIYESVIYLSYYYHKFDPETSSGNTDIVVPNFITKEIENNDVTKHLSEINNIFREHEPLVLGKMSVPYLTDEKKYLKISKDDINKNTLLLGCLGSGISNVNLSIMMQSLKAGSGFIYIDFSNDDSYIKDISLEIYNMAKLLNRQKDVVEISIYHRKEIAKIDINKFVSKNKILLINSLPLDDVSIKERERTIGDFHNLISRIKDKAKSVIPYSIFINNWYLQESENFAKLKKEISRLNKLNISFIASYAGFDVFRNGDINELFKNILILRTEDKRNLNGIDLNGLEFKDFKTSLMLPDGWFYFSKEGRIIDKNRYYCFKFKIEVNELATVRINSNSIG